MIRFVVIADGWRERWPAGGSRLELRQVGVYSDLGEACEAIDEAAYRDLGRLANDPNTNWTYADPIVPSEPICEANLPDGCGTWRAWALPIAGQGESA